MAENPIVFALANPDPEIPYADAMAARKDNHYGHWKIRSIPKSR